MSGWIRSGRCRHDSCELSRAESLEREIRSLEHKMMCMSGSAGRAAAMQVQLNSLRSELMEEIHPLPKKWWVVRQDGELVVFASRERPRNVLAGSFAFEADAKDRLNEMKDDYEAC